MAARREQGVWVNANDERATIIVNADGTAVSAGGGGGVSIVDDSAFTVAVSSLTVAGGIVTADAVDSGDAGAFAMLANRQQKVSLYDSSGVEITSFGGGTQYTEDAAAAANPVGGAIIVVRDDGRGGSLTTTDGDNVALRGTNAGELYVKHVDAIPVTDNGGVLTVDGTVAVTNAGLTELAAAINASAQMDVNIATAIPAGTNGIGKLTSNAGVTIGAVEIAAAQTLATVTTVSTVTAVTTLTGSGIAHDGADSGNPHKVGGRAISAEIAAVANNDRSDFVTDLVGKQIVLPYANPENFVSGAITSAMTGTTTTSLLAAPASGLRNYITQITVSNSHATVGTDVIIQDGSGGTTLYTIPAAAVYGGATVHFPVPLRQPTTATAIFCANVTTGSSTKVSASGYKGA